MGVVVELEQPVSEYIGNPQIEDGNTQIAHELLDAIIRFDFGKREYKIVLFVIRKTYGWKKTRDWIALSQFQAGTGLHAPHVSSTVNDLVSMNVLLKQSLDGRQVIGLNKKYYQWKLLPKQSLPKQSLPKQSFAITKTVTTKTTITKTNIPADFSISENVRKWADKNGHTNLEKHLEWFMDWATANGKKYSDWDATFRNAIRGNWAKLGQEQTQPRRKTV